MSSGSPQNVGQRTCERCGRELTDRRTDARFCSSSSRVGGPAAPALGPPLLEVVR